jgi:hypothetical protein
MHPVSSDTPYQQIRAVYDATTIRVYQAYSDAIADTALANGRFIAPPFKMARMTWIKPSFLWMMYRAGWGRKDAHQKRILAIDISREGFDWALEHSCLSNHSRDFSRKDDWARVRGTPIRIQWDPERDLLLRPLAFRAIQIGIGKEAVELFVHEWTRRITDITGFAHSLHELVSSDKLDEARNLLPEERPYTVSRAIGERLGVSQPAET